MLDSMQTLLIFTVLASAIVGGVFLTFSDFVMRALNAASPIAGMEAMQTINRTVLNSVFLALLLGLAPVMIFLVFRAPTSVWVWSGTLIYLVGVIAVTIFGNVPMNERLDKLALDTGGLEYWSHYKKRWTHLNHYRTVASVLSAAAFSVSLING